LSKEVHAGPIMQQGRPRDEQLVDDSLRSCLQIGRRVASLNTTTRQMPPCDRRDAAVNLETVRKRTAFG
jgi:hypothetical protein